MRRDALPEHTPYRDIGCTFHPSCLTCPLIRCRFDDPVGQRREKREQSAREMVALLNAGKSIGQVASLYQLNRRTVFRYLAEYRREQQVLVLTTA